MIWQKGYDTRSASRKRGCDTRRCRADVNRLYPQYLQYLRIPATRDSRSQIRAERPRVVVGSDGLLERADSLYNPSQSCASTGAQGGDIRVFRRRYHRFQPASSRLQRTICTRYRHSTRGLCTLLFRPIGCHSIGWWDGESSLSFAPSSSP